MLPLTIELDQETVRFLAALGPPEKVLAQLAYAAAEGVRRPGAWERAWLTQAFGNEWTSTLKPDPEVPFFMLPPDQDQDG